MSITTITSLSGKPVEFATIGNHPQPVPGQSPILLKKSDFTGEIDLHIAVDARVQFIFLQG